MFLHLLYVALSSLCGHAVPVALKLLFDNLLISLLIIIVN